MSSNAIFLICWVFILTSVITSDSKTVLKCQAILGSIMGIIYYAEKLL